MHLYQIKLSWVRQPLQCIDNDCTGPNFFIEQILPELSNPADRNDATVLSDSNEISVVPDSSDLEVCTSSVAVTAYSVPDNLIEERILKETEKSTESSCSLLNLGSNSANVADEIDQINERKRHLNQMADGTNEFEWESTEYFEYVFVF